MFRSLNAEDGGSIHGELNKLKNACAEWTKAYQNVNGWPTVSTFIGDLSIEGMIPVYEWSTIAKSTNDLDYITVIPIRGSHSTLQIRVTSSNESKTQLTFEQVEAVLRELTETKQWNQLYKTIQTSNAGSG